MNQLDILEQQAVESAIQFKWDEAVRLNKIIIKIDKKNLSALLRLAFANLQLGKLNDAKKYYHKALKVQATNNLAKENLEKIKILQIKKTKKGKKDQIRLDPNLFLEIHGKTKSVSLVNLGQKNILASLYIGQEVFLIPKKRKVEVRTKEKEYMGSLPDDLSKRLILFLKAKSEYSVFIKEASLNKITVFIKEQRKGKKTIHFLSFPQNLQANINDVQQENETIDETDEASVEDELEKLAETLTIEDKIYLPYKTEIEEDESEE